jgi:hypothetical protein
MVIGLLALAIRAAYVLIQSRVRVIGGGFFASDSHTYDAIAQSLLSGHGFAFHGRPTAVVTPAYPLFLAACYALFGRDFLLIGLLQSLLGAATCLLAAETARRVFDEEAAWACGLILAVLPEFVLWTSGQILTEPLYIFFLTAAVFFLVWTLPAGEEPHAGLTRNRLLLAAGAGLFLGLASLTRPLALGFAACAILYLWARAQRREALAAGAVLLLALAPWGLRNQRELGSPVLTSTEAGWVLYLYHSPDNDAQNGGYNPQARPLKGSETLTEAEESRFYFQAALRNMARHPGRELKLTANRFRNLWRPAYARSSFRNRAVSALTYLPLLALALPGFWFTPVRSPRAGLLGVFAGFFFLFHLFGAAELRFRIPMEPVIAIYAAAAGVYAFRSFFPSKASPGDRLSSEAAVLPRRAEQEILVSVIVPAFNEAERIERVLRRVRASPVRKEVIVVDDGSVDDTAGVLTRHADLYDRRCDLPENRGKGAAVLAGLREATGDVVVVQDADGELDPADYPELLEPILRGEAQVVYGSRFRAARGIRGGPAVPPLTRLANWALTGVTNLLYGCRLTDMETGYKVCPPGVLRSLELQPSRYELEPEVTAKLLSRGFSIYEVPVRYYPRPKGKKAIGLRDGLSALWVLVRIRVTKK